MRMFKKSSASKPLKAGYRMGCWRVVWDLKRDEVTLEPLRLLVAGGTDVAPQDAPPPVPPDPDLAVAELGRWLAAGVREPAEDLPPMAREDEERLRGLGYLP
jgi:hypothetical protein